jgi:hypothetical protein
MLRVRPRNPAAELLGNSRLSDAETGGIPSALTPVRADLAPPLSINGQYASASRTGRSI